MTDIPHVLETTRRDPFNLTGYGANSVLLKAAKKEADGEDASDGKALEEMQARKGEPLNGPDQFGDMLSEAASVVKVNGESDPQLMQCRR